MSLIRFKQSALPSLVDNFFTRDTRDLFEPFSTLRLPSVNIVENPEGFRLDVAAPGLKKENFQVSLHENTLVVSYQQEEEKETQTEKYTRREFRTGSFKRSFTLSDAIEPEKISAVYEDGILRLFLPRKEEAKASSERVIQIQ